MVRIQRFPQGTRIVVNPGQLPIDPEVVGQAGTIIGHHRSISDRYSVQLDGESDLRLFGEDELLLEDPR